MTFVSASQFHVYFPWFHNSVLNVKALVGAFNQEKALVGAFSMIVKTGCGTDGSIYSTTNNSVALSQLTFPSYDEMSFFCEENCPLKLENRSASPPLYCRPG